MQCYFEIFRPFGNEMNLYFSYTSIYSIISKCTLYCTQQNHLHTHAWVCSAWSPCVCPPSSRCRCTGLAPKCSSSWRCPAPPGRRWQWTQDVGRASAASGRNWWRNPDRWQEKYEFLNLIGEFSPSFYFLSKTPKRVNKWKTVVCTGCFKIFNIISGIKNKVNSKMYAVNFKQNTKG